MPVTYPRINTDSNSIAWGNDEIVEISSGATILAEIRASQTRDFVWVEHGQRSSAYGPAPDFPGISTDDRVSNQTFSYQLDAQGVGVKIPYTMIEIAYTTKNQTQRRPDLFEGFEPLYKKYTEYKKPTEPSIWDLYLFHNREDTQSYLNQYPFLIPILLKASEKIREYFPDSQMLLEIVTDPEAEDDKDLFVFILTTLAPEEAVDRLNAFDDDWWLNALDDAKGKLCIHLRFQDSIGNTI